MQSGDIKLLYDYNYWANARILDAAEYVSEEQFTTPARVSHGGLRGTLLHTFGAEWIWRTRCQEGISPTGLPAEEDFATLADLRARWQIEEEAMRAYVTGLSNEALASTIHYTSTSGNPLQNVLWQILAHLVNHGTQTRSEAAVILTEYGCSPGDLDLMLYLRQHS